MSGWLSMEEMLEEGAWAAKALAYSGPLTPSEDAARTLEESLLQAVSPHLWFHSKP